VGQLVFQAAEYVDEQTEHGSKEVSNLWDSLADADLRGIDLTAMSFDGADLRRAKLAESNLSRATFRGADLSGASLWHSECREACFDDANLEEADFDFANIDGCTFRNAKVKKAIFPNPRVTLDEILASVRTSRRVKVEPKHLDEDF